MSGSRPAKQEKVIPLGTVLMTFGVIAIVTVLAIWYVVPSRMPRSVYILVEPYLPRTGPIPTRMAIALLPESPAGSGAESAVRIPLNSVDSYSTYPEYFVAAEDALVVDAHVGKPLRIIIPTINIDAAISEVGLQRVGNGNDGYFQWEVPESFQAGWHNSSARLGEGGNTVLNGHHNIHGEIFRDLEDLEPGDKIVLHDADGPRTYQVSQKEILAEHGQPLAVRIDNSRWIEPTDDERVTLVTCWPYATNSHRLVVVATPIDS